MSGFLESKKGVDLSKVKKGDHAIVRHVGNVIISKIKQLPDGKFWIEMDCGELDFIFASDGRRDPSAESPFDIIEVIPS